MSNEGDIPDCESVSGDEKTCNSSIGKIEIGTVPDTDIVEIFIKYINNPKNDNDWNFYDTITNQLSKYDKCPLNLSIYEKITDKQNLITFFTNDSWLGSFKVFAGNYFGANKREVLESIIGKETREGTKTSMKSQLETSQDFDDLKLLVKNIDGVYDIIFEEILRYLGGNFRKGFMVLFRNYIVSHKDYGAYFIRKEQFNLIKSYLKDIKNEYTAKRKLTYIGFILLFRLYELICYKNIDDIIAELRHRYGGGGKRRKRRSTKKRKNTKRRINTKKKSSKKKKTKRRRRRTKRR